MTTLKRLSLLAVTTFCFAPSPVFSAGTETAVAFFNHIKQLCGARFEGVSVFPEDPGDAFRDKTLVAIVESCGDEVIRIPFHVGEDKSRTWILTRVANGLELKHDHRHADGTPDEVTMYGGTTVSPGTALSQSFPADDYTAKLIPEAATNEWSLTLTTDSNGMTYYLERHGKPRFKAKLKRVQ
jgi:hypothetical protein